MNDGKQITFDIVLSAFERFTERKFEYNKARDKGGYDFDYFCHDIIQAKDDAKAEAKTLLDQYIEQRVISILEERYMLLPNPPVSTE